MDLCSSALVDVFEECAKRYEAAIEAENELHERVVKELLESALECRQKGKDSAIWLQSRAASAREAISGASSSIAALTAKNPTI
jgi:hypothetical protein